MAPAVIFDQANGALAISVVVRRTRGRFVVAICDQAADPPAVVFRQMFDREAAAVAYAALCVSLPPFPLSDLAKFRTQGNAGSGQKRGQSPLSSQSPIPD